jgi:hypothetical protein
VQPAGLFNKHNIVREASTVSSSQATPATVAKALFAVIAAAFAVSLGVGLLNGVIVRNHAASVRARQQQSRSQDAAPVSESLSSPSAIASLTCDRFRIVHNLRGNTLTVSLDTDLPDFADVVVSVSRSYFERGDTEEYPLDYLSEKGTVRDWREPRRIELSATAFSKALEDRQRTAALAGLGGEIARVADEVVIDFTVPVIQSNPAFGLGNRNLTGAATTQKGMARLVKAATSVRLPLREAAIPDSQWVNVSALVTGETYRLSRETPLMPELNPTNPLAALAAVKRIPAGGVITLEGVVTKDGDPWYRVHASFDGATRVHGWINSVALTGQRLQRDRADKH